MMPDSALAQYRARYAANLTGSVAVMRRGAGVSNGAGGKTYTHTLAHTYPCLLQVPENGGREIELGGGVSAVADHILLMPHGSDVLGTDTLQVDGGPSLEVLATDKGRTNALCLTVQCKKIKG